MMANRTPFDYTVTNNKRRREAPSDEDISKMAKKVLSATEKERAVGAEYYPLKTAKKQATDSLIEAMAARGTFMFQGDDVLVTLRSVPADGITVNEQRENLQNAGFDEDTITQILKLVRKSSRHKYEAVVHKLESDGSQDTAV
jgi:hypothetical protein